MSSTSPTQTLHVPPGPHKLLFRIFCLLLGGRAVSQTALRRRACIGVLVGESCDFTCDSGFVAERSADPAATDGVLRMDGAAVCLSNLSFSDEMVCHDDVCH